MRLTSADGGNLLDFVLKRLDERRAAHRLRLDDLIVEQQLNVVDGRQDVRARVTVRDHHKLHLRQQVRARVTVRDHHELHLRQQVRARVTVRDHHKLHLRDNKVNVCLHLLHQIKYYINTLSECLV